MYTSSRSIPRLARLRVPRCPRRSASTATAKKEGDISNSFVSLSGGAAQPLPPRFRALKQSLIAGREDAVRVSFQRLLSALRSEIPAIAERGPSSVPEIAFSDLANPPASFTAAHRRTGLAVIRGVVPEAQAVAWLDATRDYIRANPRTSGFPAERPAVWELYWSPAQVAARADPRLLRAQRFLLSHWHANGEPFSAAHPVAYADRLRIRPPGDGAFALGPHVDGGSCERWERDGYGDAYGCVFRGAWEELDPFDAGPRLRAVSDLYGGAGACSAFRAYQGWLGLSHTGPGEGTLRVSPLLARATAYLLLRPFFAPRRGPADAGFLDDANWDLETSVLGDATSALQGAFPGHGQELSEALHPHLELGKSVVSVPAVRPGDYIAWHCDSVHAVDATHGGKRDAAVFYSPACPLTEANAEYLVRQRDTFLNGTPSPDFPGGRGEADHVGRPEPAAFVASPDISLEAKRSMGMVPWDLATAKTEQERSTLQRANQILGF